MISSKMPIFESIQISGICIGVGAALTFLGVGHLAGNYLVKAVMPPRIHEASLREENYERNIRVREKDGWNASRITIYILLLLTVASACMNIGLFVTILLVSVIIIESSLVTGSLIYYEKRM